MLLEKVKTTLKKYQLVFKNDRLLVGVSGGPDSTALLYILHSLAGELKLSLCIAHLDHCLRKDSVGDRKFVQGLAKKLELPIITARLDLKKKAKNGGSLEEICRNKRLEFFFRAAKHFKTKKIVLGHNLDDQAETVLMRILRGTGLYGLSGMLPKREIYGFEIIRPLIEVRRRQIEKYLKNMGIRPCLDRSNLQDLYLRNKIRNRLLPQLEKEYNPRIKEGLSNLAEASALDYDYLGHCAQKIIAGGSPRINLKKFLKLHPAIQRLLLRFAISRIKGDMRRITFTHIREIEDLINCRPISSIVDLPKGVSVVKRKNSLLFYRR